MSGQEELAGALRDELRRLAYAEAPAILSQARERALARARETLEQALYEELLAAVERVAPNPSSAASELAEPVRGGTARAETAEVAWWAYCVLPRAETSPGLAELTGVEPGTSVELVVEDDLAALVSPVPLSEFGDERLREHLEDMRWVERVALGHEAVIEAALRTATVVPLRLCTICRDRDGVRRLLSESRATFSDAVASVAGCEEWGVKVFATAAPGGSEAAPHPGAVAEQTGTGYLAARRRERDQAQHALDARLACAEEVHDALSAIARAAATNPPQRPEAHGRPGTMLLNGAYLVERERVTDLRQALDEMREQWEGAGIEFELTGPWPAYNFVSGPSPVMP